MFGQPILKFIPSLWRGVLAHASQLTQGPLTHSVKCLNVFDMSVNDQGQLGGELLSTATTRARYKRHGSGSDVVFEELRQGVVENGTDG